MSFGAHSSQMSVLVILQLLQLPLSCCCTEWNMNIIGFTLHYWCHILELVIAGVVRLRELFMLVFGLWASCRGFSVKKNSEMSDQSWGWQWAQQEEMARLVLWLLRKWSDPNPGLLLLPDAKHRSTFISADGLSGFSTGTCKPLPVC